jgi:hypothetical protein
MKMKKDLYIENDGSRVLIRVDDLKYDGKNIVIPSYWADSIYDYMRQVKTSGLADADIDDFNSFMDFITKVTDYKSDNYGN